jgi:hypothetical protein
MNVSRMQMLELQFCPLKGALLKEPPLGSMGIRNILL